MSVLIKGMEMPPNCSECAFCGYYGNKTHLCDINQQEIDYEAMLENRRDDCPLVEIPPHGRLIDANVLMENEENISFKDEWHMTVTEAFVSVKNIAHAPTIIEAEEGKDD